MEATGGVERKTWPFYGDYTDIAGGDDGDGDDDNNDGRNVNDDHDDVNDDDDDTTL